MAEASTHYCSRCLTSFSVDPEHCLNLACQQPKPKKGWGRILNPGELFDRCYRIHRLLAMGGGGITYLAKETDESGNEFGSLLAIKALFAHREQGSYLRRLATEAQILQEMNDPHIVAYRGFVHRTGHTPYLVTRFESGGSLLDHVRRVGTLPVRQAAAIGHQICEALRKAHNLGVIHRDLKPENILLAETVEPGVTPHIRVVDFGIAKVNSSLHSNITRMGAFVGTPHFAAPEQFIGATITPHSDVYSVGAMLYFCMMGRHLVAVADQLAPEDSYQVLLKNLPGQINRPDDPPQDVARINRVFQHVLCARPSQRCSATELGEQLDAICRGEEPPAFHPPPPPPEEVAFNTPSDTIISEPEPVPDEPITEPEPPVDPPSTKTSWGCLIGGGVMLAGALLASLAVVGWWSLQDPTPTVNTAVPILTGHETDADVKRDYRLIYDSLEHFKPYLQEQCSLPDNTSVLLEVELSAATDSRSDIVGVYIHEGTGDCIAQQLIGLQVNRHQSTATRCPKLLTWP